MVLGWETLECNGKEFKRDGFAGDVHGESTEVSVVQVASVNIVAKETLLFDY